MTGSRRSWILAWVLLGGLASFDHAPGQVLRVIAMPPGSSNPSKGAPMGRPVDESLLLEWRRLRERAVADGVTTLVFEITTPGGDVRFMLPFIDDLEDLRAKGVRTLAFVPDSATSAGAIIAVACHELIMGPKGEIGNAIPMLYANGRYEMAGPKHLTEVNALMERLASTTRFKDLLLRAMVDPNIEVLLVRKDGAEPEVMDSAEFDRNFPSGSRPSGIRTQIIVPKGVALKLPTHKLALLKPWFPFEEVLSRDGLPKLLGFGDRPLSKEELLEMTNPDARSFFDEFLFGLDWSVLLLVLGIVFIILEFNTPGLGVAGVLGLLCFVGYFALNAESGAPLAITTGLLILGFFLLLAEILIIPGFGVAGIAGIILIVGSIYAASVGLEGQTLRETLIPDSEEDWLRVQAWALRFFGGLVFGVGGALLVIPRLHMVPFLQTAYLKPAILERPGRPSGAAAPGPVGAAGTVSLQVGAIGVTDCDLRPSGRATFEGHIVDVVSSGDWIPRAASVRVVKIEGNRVVVQTTGGAS